MAEQQQPSQVPQAPPPPPQEDPNALTPTYITKNVKTMTEDQIAIALTTPELAPQLLAVVTKFNDNQLRAAGAIMSLDQIKTTVPKLQLQQTGAFVSAMSPPQVRHLLASLTTDDRNLLMQNIALLTSSSTKDELESFIAFVDPLAMAIAVGLPELTGRILRSSGVMTVEQIRVCVPVMSLENIRDLISILEHDSQIDVSISMIDRKDDLIKLIEDSWPALEKQKKDISTRLSALSSRQLPELEQRITRLSVSDNKASEYDLVVRNMKNTKAEIESLQMTTRDIQAQLKLPLKIASSSSDLFNKAQTLSKELTEIAKELSTHFRSNDALINLLNREWESIKPIAAASNSNRETESVQTAGEPLSNSSDSIFEDDRAILLYEAIKEIGNPDAVGSHYAFSWNDIIESGFRTSKDFKEKGISTLEQLQKYIQSQKASVVS
mmetsp:Transcript_28999/g.40816  ORF Transcript_28999/g.40816 Transcript_28999/m.40816 type:complete len:438 (+) Transcript_28999:99-1412(+)